MNEQQDNLLDRQRISEPLLRLNEVRHCFLKIKLLLEIHLLEQLRSRLRHLLQHQWLVVLLQYSIHQLMRQMSKYHTYL